MISSSERGSVRCALLLGFLPAGRGLGSPACPPAAFPAELRGGQTFMRMPRDGKNRFCFLSLLYNLFKLRLFKCCMCHPCTEMTELAATREQERGQNASWDGEAHDLLTTEISARWDLPRGVFPDCGSYGVLLLFTTLPSPIGPCPHLAHHSQKCLHLGVIPGSHLLGQVICLFYSPLCSANSGPSSE